MLETAFRDRSAFTPEAPYRLLPFRFGPLEGSRYILTNEVGEYVILNRDKLDSLVERNLVSSDPAYKELKAKHFLFDEHSRIALDLLAIKYRTRVEPLTNLTGLHIFVVTLRCDHSCHYCQVSRQTEDRASFDMSAAHADRALDLVFRTPASAVKIEFQGGEPLLNFDLIRHVVEQAKERNSAHEKDVRFVIASNLSRLTDEILVFCRDNGVTLSTSLDGPRDLHDTQRPVRDGSSFDKTVGAISRARTFLGPDGVSALMTTTRASLQRVDEIVDEYVRQDFRSIFLRSLSPYGFAVRQSLNRRYDEDAWLAFFQRGLDYIIGINRKGYFLREEFTTILLQKMFSPSGPAYVDLQSPAGIGIGALVYNYDGAVYASDEGRMLAEMGDQSFPPRARRYRFLRGHDDRNAADGASLRLHARGRADVQ